MKKLFFFFFPVFLLAEIGYVNFSAGVFDFLRSKYRTAEVRVEYQAALSRYWVHPLAGILQSFKGATYVYGGLALDINLKNFLVVPSLAAGYYHQGGGKDLGCPLEFRSAILLGYQLSNKFRIGLQISHISNASLGSKNPGEESLCVVLGLPIDRSRRKTLD